MGGIEMPIYYSAISRWANDHGITGEAFDRLVRFVSEIDNAYLDAQRRAAETKPGHQEQQ